MKCTDRDAEIYVVHTESIYVSLSNSERKRKLHELYAWSTREDGKGSTLPKASVSFSKVDKHNTEGSNFDVLVVTIEIGGYQVWRALINGGSAHNLLFKEIYRKLSADRRRLDPTGSVAFGFTDIPNKFLGMVYLPIRVGSGRIEMAMMIKFLVVDSKSSYNAVMGRKWLYDLKTMTSSFH